MLLWEELAETSTSLKTIKKSALPLPEDFDKPLGWAVTVSRKTCTYISNSVGDLVTGAFRSFTKPWMSIIK